MMGICVIVVIAASALAAQSKKVNKELT